MFTPTGVTGTSLAFDGPIVFTPKVSSVGTLTAQVTGASDLSTGAFHVSSTSITGTGHSVMSLETSRSSATRT